MVVSPPSTVSPRDRFLSPIYDGRESYELGSRSTLVYWLGPLPSWHLLENYFGYLDKMMFQVMTLTNFVTVMALYSILVFTEINEL